MSAASRLVGFVTASLTWTIFATALTAGEIIQHFPATEPKAKMRTAWRIEWDVTRHGGGSEILYIKRAWFKRGPKEREIKVLGDCRLAECFVPYNNGHRVYDIVGNNFDLEAVSPNDLGPVCVGSPKVFNRKGVEISLDELKGKKADEGIVALEFHDDYLRWRNRWAKSRRGQEMQLWAVLDATNYRYIIMYTFRDDGRIGFRLGATAHNLYPTNADTAAHIHTGCWRLNVELGDAANNDVQVVRYLSRPGTNRAMTLAQPFNRGFEGGINWKAEEFTRLRIVSRTIKNKHNPPNRIGYELISRRAGNSRQYGRGEEFTLRDFWVTRANPKKQELNFRNVPTYANGQLLKGAHVIWHQCSAWHTPRDEDFGANGYDSNQGVALTAWAEFSLRPRNFFAKTPLYP